MTDLITLARSLLEAAQKATPGPWHAEELYLIGRPEGCRPNGEVIASMDYARVLNFEEKERNAAYIALCSPDAIAQLAEGYLAAEERARGAEQNEGYMRADLERAERDAARLREIVEHMIVQHVIDRGGPERHAIVICSHGPILAARAALAEGKPEPPPSEKEVAP